MFKYRQELHEGQRIFAEHKGYVIWGTVHAVLDDGRGFVKWDEGNPLDWEATLGVYPDCVTIPRDKAESAA